MKKLRAMKKESTGSKWTSLADDVWPMDKWDDYDNELTFIEKGD
jgi:hypothetical protein